MDPPGILGGSEVNSGDPATMALVKTGGSVETTASMYNIRKGDVENIAACVRILSAGVVSDSKIFRVVVRQSKCLRVLRHFREGAFGRGRRLACQDMEACAYGC